jgi:hypothetical protein
MNSRLLSGIFSGEFGKRTKPRQRRNQVVAWFVDADARTLRLAFRWSLGDQP